MGDARWSGGYRLAAGSDLPPLLFDDEQAVAIAVALQSVPSSGVDIDEAASRALTTLRQVMPSRLRHRIDAIRFTDTASDTLVNPTVLEAVVTAVRAQRTLRFDYSTGAEVSDQPPHRVEPHAVVARKGRWYLIAWDLELADWRTFRLDRMQPRLPEGAPFSRRPLPAPDGSTFLDARLKGSEWHPRWPCQGTFILELPAHDVAPWLDDGELEELDDRSCKVSIGSWSWAGLIAWVLRFDAPFTIVGPGPLLAAGSTLSTRLTTAADPTTPPRVTVTDE